MESLLLYELVLLITGSVFFLALVFVLIFYVVKNKPIKNVFSFFIFPIIMMGFPSFQSFKFENGKIEIQKKIVEVRNNPTDETSRKELEKAIAAINPLRIKKDAEASTYVAEAQLELGNIPESEKAIQNALVLEKNDPKVKAVKNSIEKEKTKILEYKNNIDKLKEIETKVSGGSITQQEKNKITEILTKTEVPKYTDEKSQLVIAKSLNQIGDKESSSKVIENVLATNPASREAIAVKKDIAVPNDTTVTSDAPKMKVDVAKFNAARIRKN